jgi:tRNA-dihydrouridine synthase B
MIGRAAQGAPWLCGAIDAALQHGGSEQAPPRVRRQALLLEHVDALHGFYGEQQGLRIARKHVAWTLGASAAGRGFLRGFHALECGSAQLDALREFFNANEDEHGVMAA